MMLMMSMMPLVSNLEVSESKWLMNSLMSNNLMKMLAPRVTGPVLTVLKAQVLD
jgi:hypothetical protein